MNARRGWRRRTLSRQLIAVTAVLFVAFGVTLSTLASEQESTSLYQALETTARNNGQLLAPSFVNQLLRSDLTGMRQSSAAISAEKGVLDIRVLDDRGRTVLARGQLGSPGREGERRNRAVQTQHAFILRRGRLLDSVQPLSAGGTRVGTLVIGYDLEGARRTVLVNRARNLLAGLAFSVVAALATWLLLRRLTLRLVGLTSSAQSAAEEQLPALLQALQDGADVAVLAPPSLDVVRDDEIGRLSSAFNAYRSVVVDMAAKLSAALNSSEARLQRAFESSPIGMAISAPDGRLMEVNPALCAMLGRAPADVIGRTLAAFSPAVGAKDGESVPGDADGQGMRYFVRPDGSPVWALQATTREPQRDETPGPMFIQLVDTTQQRQSQEKLAHLAFHDSLTGLSNRALMRDRLSHALAARPPRCVSVLLLDLDDFKSVNDISGHAAGDRLLVEVARRLAACVRPGDTVGRLGGDEFIILVEDCSQAEAVAQRVLEKLAEPVTIDGRQVVPVASIGVAHNNNADLNADDLVRRADVAMYAAKAGGKGRYECFRDDMAEALVAKADLETGLRAAVTNGEIVVHYQPVLGVGAERMVQVEALARWQRPGGLVPPMDFIPVAEQSGLILAIGQEVLAQACHQMAPWLREERGRSVAVNVSAVQLGQPTFAQTVLETLDQAGLEPRHLALEVTETMVLDAGPRAVGQLTELRGLGITVAIDDFGTGYSSLGRLHELPVDSVKIDKMFVAEVRSGREEMPILASMIEMAHHLGLEVTAEGVETAEQAARLIALGCEYLQGYYFSRPQPFTALTSHSVRAEAAMARFGDAHRVAGRWTSSAR